MSSSIIPMPVLATNVVSSRSHYYPVAVILLVLTLGCIPLKLVELPIVFTCLLLAVLTAIDLRAVLILAFPIYALLGAQVSVVLIERGAYVSEQFRYGFNIGASPALASYAMAFLLVAHASVRICMIKLPTSGILPKMQTLKLLVIAGSALVALVYLVLFLQYGVGISLQDQRFGWARRLPPLMAAVHGFFAAFAIPAMFGLVGLHFGLHGRLYFWHATLVLPVLALFLVGEKFSAFASGIFMCLAGVGIAGYVTKKDFRINLIWVTALGLASAILLYSIMLGYERTGSVNASQMVAERLVLQGHVWFGIFEAFRGAPEIPAGAIFAQNSLENPAGLDLLSYYVTVPEFVRSRIGLGVSFTMGGPASFLAAFGFWGGLIFFAILSVLFGFVARAIVAFCERDAGIRAAFGFIFFLLLIQTTQMGRWDNFWGTVAVACYLCFLTLFLPHRRKRVPQF